MNRAYQVTGFGMDGKKHKITVEEYTKELRNYCNECGKLGDDTFLNYCPNCGAYNGEEKPNNH